MMKHLPPLLWLLLTGMACEPAQQSTKADQDMPKPPTAGVNNPEEEPLKPVKVLPERPEKREEAPPKKT